MKNTICWRMKFFSVCFVILSTLFIWGCADSGDDSNPFDNNSNYDYSHPQDDENGNILIPGLVAYYPFNGNAHDASGNGNNGTVNGATLTTDRHGHMNSAYYFDGSSGIRCVVGNELSLSYVTLAAWINIESSGGQNPRIVAVNYPGTSSGYYALLMWGTGNPRFLTFQEQDDLYNSASKLSNNSGWHHVALTYDGSHVTFYVDGVADPALGASDSSLTPFTNAVLNIGYSDNNLDRFNGDIDEVRIYNYALSASEIWELYNLVN